VSTTSHPRLLASHSTMTTSPPPVTNDDDGKFHFAIDRGGTFTDVHCRFGRTELVRKLLSEDPAHYTDAPTEGIRRILQEFDSSHEYPRGAPVNTAKIGSIRMGTTVATNALLERDGAPMAFLVTRGFADILEIGNQGVCNVIVCATCDVCVAMVGCWYKNDGFSNSTSALLSHRQPDRISLI